LNKVDMGRRYPALILFISVPLPRSGAGPCSTFPLDGGGWRAAGPGKAGRDNYDHEMRRSCGDAGSCRKNGSKLTHEEVQEETRALKQAD
jgi:hypothetical protein